MKPVGLTMRAKIDEISRLWILVELELALEKFSTVKLSEGEMDSVQTLRDLIRIVQQNMSEGDDNDVSSAVTLVREAVHEAASWMRRPMATFDDSILDYQLINVIYTSPWNGRQGTA